MPTADASLINLVFLIVWASLTVLAIVAFVVSKFIIGFAPTAENKASWTAVILTPVFGLCFTGIVVLATFMLGGY